MVKKFNSPFRLGGGGQHDEIELEKKPRAKVMALGLGVNGNEVTHEQYQNKNYHSNKAAE